MRKKTFTICILGSCCLFVGFINSIKSEYQDSMLANSANQFMWDNFHLGNYDSIPSIISKLKVAYKQDPKNPKVTSYIAFTSLWAFSERGRKDPDPSISYYVYQSNYFFKEAIKLNPEDARLRGFQSVTDICEGALKKNPAILAKGYINGLRSINKWPQFNKFAFSLIGSQRNKNSFMYKTAMKFQWQLIDDCSCKDLDKKTVLSDPDKVFTKLIAELKQSTDSKLKRVCWNSWIAPHNLEGFFLNFGDMLVKEGNIKEAREIYSAARLSPDYNNWPFQSVLEDRIRNAEINEVTFNKPLELIITTHQNQIFINSAFSCVGCHQMSKKEFEIMLIKNYN